MKVSRFTFNMFGVNTYVLWDEVSKDAVIVDPGMVNLDEQAMVDDFINKNNLKITHLINTHMHIDHSFGISYISAKYNVNLEANMADQFLAERLNAQAEMFGIPMKISDLEINKNLVDGNTITIGDESLLILQVPGHSPGSIVLYSPVSSFVISGDVLFKNSIGRSDLPGGNYNQLIGNIKSKLMTLPDDVVVYPGHGLETTIGEEKINNPFL